MNTAKIELFREKLSDAYHTLGKVTAGERGYRKAAAKARKLLTEIKKEITPIKRETIITHGEEEE